MKTFLSSADGRRGPLEEEEKVTPHTEQANVPAVKKTTPKKSRGPKLTPALGRAIVAAIAAGNFPGVAARLAGVGTVTVANWLKLGDQGKRPYADFAEAYRRAEDTNESQMIEIWKKAAPDDWRSVKEYLAKRHPERWSDHAARLAVLGPEGNAYGRGADNCGLHITLNLGDNEEDFSQTPKPVERIVEIEDHNKRALELEHTEMLVKAPVKDKL